MIYDSRPRLNAEANKLKGGGYEDCGMGKNYSNCELKFCNIANIHDVKAAFDKMCSLAYTNPIHKDAKHQLWIQQVDSTGYRQIL